MLFLLLVVAPGCDSGPVDPHETVVAKVGKRPLTLADFESYLAMHLIGLEETADGEVDATNPSDEVKSRLFDAFVEEYLLLAAALQRGVDVEPWEVDAYMAVDEPEDENDEVDYGARRREALRRLLVQKLREEATLVLPEPSEDEVRAYAEANRETLAPQRRLELRALMLESMDEAKQVHREIKRRHITFNEAVVRHEAYPGQSRAQVLDWESLSEPVREALDGLKRGRVSEPVEMNGSVYLFRVETWLDEPGQLEEALLQRARRELERERRQQALDDLLREVREATKVRLKRTRLPFDYVP